MDTNVRLNYEQYPEKLSSGIIKISDDKSMKISFLESENVIVIELRDTSFGGENKIEVKLTYEMTKDLYKILYILLNQYSKE